VLREHVWLVNSRVVAGGSVAGEALLGVVNSWRTTFWYIGFPLLECGPTGPLGPSAVFGSILTNRRWPWHGMT
jgi:hypothetical protein